MQQLEFKAAPSSVKDVDVSQGVIVGHAATFGNLDRVGDVIEPGAFKATLNGAGQKAKVLYQHDPTRLIGKPLVMREDEKGLYTESKIADTTLGRDVLTLAQEGVLTDLSIGYDVVKATKDKEGNRHLKEVRLWEYSYVTFPASPLATVLGVKSLMTPDALKEQMARAEKALANAEWQTDEVPEMLSLALKHWQGILETPAVPEPDFEKAGRRFSAASRSQLEGALKIIQSLLEDTEPSDDTQRDEESKDSAGPLVHPFAELAAELKTRPTHSEPDYLGEFRALSRQLKGN